MATLNYIDMLFRFTGQTFKRLPLEIVCLIKAANNYNNEEHSKTCGRTWLIKNVKKEEHKSKQLVRNLIIVLRIHPKNNSFFGSLLLSEE